MVEVASRIDCCEISRLGCHQQTAGKQYDCRAKKVEVAWNEERFGVSLEVKIQKCRRVSGFRKKARKKKVNKIREFVMSMPNTGTGKESSHDPTNDGCCPDATG